MLALILLTGARDNAIAPLWLKHVDLREGNIVQVRAMFVPRAKTIKTYFYPVGDDFRTVVEEGTIFLQPYLDSR